MKRLLIPILLLVACRVVAQGYEIEVLLSKAKNKEVQLTYYYLGQIYSTDTIQLNENGNGTFKGDSLLPQGLYKIFLDKDNHFDFLLGAEQQFKLSNQTFKNLNAEFEGATESEAFVEYLNFLEDLKQQSADLKKQLKTASDQQKVKIQKKQKKLDREMKKYWETTGKKFPNSFLYKFITANYVPTLDESNLPKTVLENDSLLLRARFNYQLEHFWDYFDYTDERYLYTPFYKPKLETWFNKVLYPAYDSVKPYVYTFLNKVKSNKRIFQFATSFFLNSSINSKILGMDALFVDLANDFYLNGEAFWASEESLEKIRENVMFMKDNLIGKTAPDLTLESFDGEFINLHQIESKLTVLLIYEPHCSHCKTFVPQFYKKVFLPNKDLGLTVYAIYSMDKKEEWGEFLSKHNMFEWINVWDKDHVSRFKIKYDGRKTPGVYVLDEQKKIISKKLTIKQLQKIISQHLN